MAEQSFSEYNSFSLKQGIGLSYVEQNENTRQVVTRSDIERKDSSGQPITTQKTSTSQKLSPSLPPSPAHESVSSPRPSSRQTSLGPTSIPSSSQQPSASPSKLDHDQIRARMLPFSGKSTRSAFFRKVYIAMTVQIVILGVLVVLFYRNNTTFNYYRTDFPDILIVLIGNTTICLALACYQSVARRFPVNYLFFFVLTLSNSLLLTLVAIHHQLFTVLVAIIFAVLAFISLALFTTQTYFNVGINEQTICIIVVTLLAVVAVLSIYRPDRPVEVIGIGTGVLIFSFIAIYDTRLMVGGRHTYAITPNDYIFAALSVYLDIINFFLDILRNVQRIANEDDIIDSD